MLLELDGADQLQTNLRGALRGGRGASPQQRAPRPRGPAARSARGKKFPPNSRARRARAVCPRLAGSRARSPRCPRTSFSGQRSPWAPCPIPSPRIVLEKADEVGGVQVALRREDRCNDGVEGEAAREVRQKPGPEKRNERISASKFEQYGHVCA